MKRRVRLRKEISVDVFGFMNDGELRNKLDKIAEEWGCPNVDDPYYRYTGQKDLYNAHFILHYTRKHCTHARHSGDYVLCMRSPLNGNRKNVYVEEHLYNACKCRNPEYPY